MPKSLSDAHRQNLLKAIEKAAGYVNDGLDPNHGIAKAAVDCGIPAGHLNLMVHAYNTGRTNQQRTDADTLTEKAADFPLADAETVLELMYPTTVKTAVDNYHATTVSLDYAVSPTGTLARKERMEKLAAAGQIDWLMVNGQRVEPPKPYPRESKEQLRKAASGADRLYRQVAELRRTAAAAFDKMAGTFETLTDYFRSPSSLPIPTVRESAMLVHGEKGEQLLDQLVRVTPGLNKLSAHAAAPARPPAWVGRPFTVIDTFMEDLAAYKAAKDNYEKTAAALGGEAEALLRPFAPSVPQSILGGPLSTEKRGGTAVDWMSPVALGTSIYANVEKNFEPPEKSKLKADMLSKITDPRHESTLRNIRSQANLQDLVANDPIISQRPDEALEAFNELNEASPRIADQKLLLRAMLRQRLEQGNLDPFQIDQLLGMEDKMRKRDIGLGLQQGAAGDESVLG